MILRQFLHPDPAVAVSSLVGCGGKGIAAVVDPVAAPEIYVEAARAGGMLIRYVIDTHLHADHVSTARDLAAWAEAEYVLHASAGALFPFLAVADGDRLELGNVFLDVLHVPGHTPEHLALLVVDRTRGPEVWCAFTGHTLMVGDMGRTELASDPAEGARALLESGQRLKRLPDFVEVLPGAFAGSVCGRRLSGKVSSTIGFERRFNRAFAIDDQETFVQTMLEDIPPPPAHAAEIRDRNMGRVPVSLT